MALHPFRWEADPDYTDPTPPCPQCGSTTEALRVEPDRSPVYCRAIFLCTGDSGRPGPGDHASCRMAWPRAGARRFAA